MCSKVKQFRENEERISVRVREELQEELSFDRSIAGKSLAANFQLNSLEKVFYFYNFFFDWPRELFVVFLSSKLTSVENVNL